MVDAKTNIRLGYGKESPLIQTDAEYEDIQFIDVTMSFREAVNLLPGNANVRLPKKNARTIKAMLETVEKAPTQFHLRNRGITYHCINAKIDTDKKQLIITLPADGSRKDSKKFGILDGGHTFEVIKYVMEHVEEYKGNPDWLIPRVRIRFYLNVPEEVLPSVVEALNTSVQVKETSLSEYRNEFEWYKRILSEQGWKPDTVAYREGEVREWTIGEINQRASCFLKSVWMTKLPIDMYKSAGRALRMFYKGKMQEEYDKLENVLTDVVTLPEFIVSRLSDSGLLEGKVVERTGFVKRLKKPETRLNTEYPSKVRIGEGITLPLAASFRELLTSKDGLYRWEVDYKDVYDLIEAEWFEMMVKKLRQFSGKVSALGSDSDYWHSCQSLVMRGKERIKDGETPPVRRKHSEKDEEDQYQEKIRYEDLDEAP